MDTFVRLTCRASKELTRKLIPTSSCIHRGRSHRSKPMARRNHRWRWLLNHVNRFVKIHAWYRVFLLTITHFVLNRDRLILLIRIRTLVRFNFYFFPRFVSIRRIANDGIHVIIVGDWFLYCNETNYRAAVRNRQNCWYFDDNNEYNCRAENCHQENTLRARVACTCSPLRIFTRNPNGESRILFPKWN